VRQSKCEREEWLRAIVLVAAITDKYPFLVNHAFSAGFGIVAVVFGVVFPLPLKGNWQATRWVYISEENFGECRAALLTWIPRLNQRRNAIEPRTHVHTSARSHDDYRIL